LGRGTTFTLLLPVAEAGLAFGSATQHATVLLVEPQRALRDLAGRALRLNGYRVVDAEDASEALTEADHHSGRIDLLVLDPAAANEDGAVYELERKLRLRNPALRRLHTSDVPSPVASAMLIGGGVDPPSRLCAGRSRAPR
jgi:CheY-like chemotaxis protein